MAAARRSSPPATAWWRTTAGTTSSSPTSRRACPGPEHHFLINPYGMLFDEITASSLVKVDLDGRKVDRQPVRHEPGRVHHPQRHPRRPRGRARASCTCTASTASRSRRRTRACCRCRSTRSSCSRRSATTTTRASRSTTTRSRAWSATSADNRFLMLRNHGLLTVGAIGRRGVRRHVPLRDHLHDPGARAGGRRRAAVASAPPIVAGAQAQWDAVTRGTGGGLAWPALLRRLDREDPGYRD